MDIDRDNMECLYPDELDMIHYRVFTSRGLLPDILPNINLARKVAMETISSGGSAIILETKEKLTYNSGSIDKIELTIWP